jgi:hypothetical protein
LVFSGVLDQIGYFGYGHYRQPLLRHLAMEITGDKPGQPKSRRVHGPLANTWDSMTRYWVATLPETNQQREILDLLG